MTPAVRTVTLIETHLCRRGSGIVPSLIRSVAQWWTPDGTLVAENDPTSIVLTAEQLHDFRLRSAALIADGTVHQEIMNLLAQIATT